MKQGTCRHFTGTKEKLCLAKVTYKTLESVVEGKIKLPCMLKYKGEIDCAKYEEPTAEELKESEKRINEIIGKLQIVGPIIKKLKKAYKGKSKKGVIKCPVCEGNLAYSIASCNGHVLMACQTKGCISFIQ